MSTSLLPYRLQHTRLPCPSPSPGVCSNSCPLCQWCHPTISSYVALFFSCFQSFSASVFSSELALCIRWSKYWSFSISPPNEYSRLISFRTDWFNLTRPGDSQESSPTPQFKSIDFSVLSFLYGSFLTSVCDCWKNHSFDLMDLCWQSDVSAF